MFSIGTPAVKRMREGFNLCKERMLYDNTKSNELNLKRVITLKTLRTTK
jgi:hypothetical protein